MNRAVTNEDYSNQTLKNLTGYFMGCNFNGVTLTGTVKAVFKDCTANPLTLDNAEIERLHTPNTKLPNVIIDKRTFQPIHWFKCQMWQQHNHEYNAGLLRRTLPQIEDRRLRNVVSKAADYIEAHPEYSWGDFLYKIETPKEVWELYEVYYFDDPDHKRMVEEVIKVRWP